MKQADAKAGATDVYLSFVTSLFGNRGALIAGMAIYLLSCVFIYVDTGSRFFLFLIAAFIFVFFFRLYWFHRFDQVDRSRLTLPEIRAWETRYVYGAALTAVLLGISSGYAVAVLRETTAVFISIAVTMGAVVSVIGRNYGSGRAVAIQTVGCCLPVMVGCFFSGNIALIGMSLMLIPFGFTTQSMAKGVREFLSENMLAARQMVKLSGQLDLALSTTAHALIILDAEGRVQAINRRAYDLLSLDEKRDLKGSLFLPALRESVFPPSPATLDRIERLAGGASGKMILAFGTERSLEFSVSHQADGGVVMIFEDVTDRVSAEERILHLVRYDALTGLPNRDYFGTLAAQRLSAADPELLAGLAILDIDGFRHVNDMQSHAVGDGLLAAIAARLKRMPEEELLIGRLVGDEFLLFVTGDHETIEQRMRSIHRDIEGSYAVKDRKLSVFLNGGCVILPAGAFDLDAWHIKADLALNEAKSTGNGAFTLFRPEMDERYVDEQSLRADLRQALDQGDLTLVYQPMYRPDGSRMECCEALVRWAHPERGWVGPNIFVPLAESMGLVSHITRFVLDRACSACASWPAFMTVSVNVSIEDLRNDDLVAYVAETLARHGLDARRLHLEVTESCFMDEPVVVRSILGRLRASGVTIAIDDFGTGFSSLSYLDTLPVDMVKIDRTFVTNITEDERKLKLLRGIVHLSRELGMIVVLEGVETQVQIALIAEYGFADLIQGFVFSRPVDGEQIARLAAEQVSRQSLAAGR
ncbi:EAL domain-containing protein [Neorhizobium lilium]|uniref:EAL domain-containing protein n=1 Tax=Neorhizobium lilium TaxID=2503024 RepID=A0A444LJ97_9HYPH|nr:EAL domain-containing protein [Neorhizobium lilium]RWX79120.1 EAL domain-containing protein [Neorhizobium lilium]